MGTSETNSRPTTLSATALREKPIRVPGDDRSSRVVISALRPEVDGGRFPAQRCLGDTVAVSAQMVTDGHDLLAGVLRYRFEGEASWLEVPLALENRGLDLWSASFVVDRLGAWEFMVAAWVDEYGSWLHGLRAKVAAGQDVGVACERGGILLQEAAARARQPEAADRLSRAAATIVSARAEAAVAIASDPPLIEALRRGPAPGPMAESAVRRISVDPKLGRFSAWYEFFPRSTGAAGAHGTFSTAKERLRYAASMGFDVVYLPPIHPIGQKNRKGPNNSVTSSPGDPGSPWAIGSAEGGHTAIHPELGTMADFEDFLGEARRLGIEVALDIAFQCAPDHPWVREHPEWFRHEPDGSIAYAENPPKRYEDIVPFNFECEEWRALWDALLGVVEFWVERGVRVLRVDNPHTKPLPFWEWLIGEVRRKNPEVIFLAEAFARPALVHGLAKRGFNQSVTYFAWRNTKAELQEYLTELTEGPGSDYLRPNFWANTPDILTEYLQVGGRSAAFIRLLLAATLSASYGIYGPPFETGFHEAVHAGSEEYRDSEKYQLRRWDIDAPWSLREVIARVNAIRNEHPALHRNDTLVFHRTDNERVICYSKQDGDDLVVVVVSLDPHNGQAATVHLDEERLGLSLEGQYIAADLLGGGNYVWFGPSNYVELQPSAALGHIFSLRRNRRTERDFDYFF